MHKPQAIYSKAIIIVILLNLFLLSGCQTEETSNSNRNIETAIPETEKSNPASDNIEELLNRVRLPEVPEEVVWKEETLGKGDNRVPGPTDTKITAVLKYTPEISGKLIAILEKYKQGDGVEVDTESWFPEELVAQAQLSGAETIKGTSYGANEFFNVPYGSGRITRINNTDYFVLELMAN